MNEEPRLLSKMEKGYFLKLMSGLDMVDKIESGCIMAKEGPHNMYLYEYGIPGQGKGAELLALTSDEEIDRFSYLENFCLSRGIDGFGTGLTIYRPTERGRELYYQLIKDEIIYTVEDYWRNHSEDGPGLVSIRRYDIGQWHISISLETFTRCIEVLVQEGKVIDYSSERPTEIETARLYLPPVTSASAMNIQTQNNVAGTQNNVGNNQYNAGGNIHFHNGNDKGSGSKEEENP